MKTEAMVSISKALFFPQELNHGWVFSTVSLYHLYKGPTFQLKIHTKDEIMTAKSFNTIYLVMGRITVIRITHLLFYLFGLASLAYIKINHIL